MPCFADAEHLPGQDGFTLQYGNPANPTNVTEQISKIRQHLFKMKGQTFDATGHAVDAMLPIAPCPGVEAEYTYMSGMGQYDGKDMKVSCLFHPGRGDHRCEKLHTFKSRNSN
jgi:hypothetical protein